MLYRLSYRVFGEPFRWVMGPFVRRHVIGQIASRAGHPLLLAPNHVSHFDPTLIGLAVPRPLDWMAMAELWGHPVVGFVCERLGAFPVRRGQVDRSAIRTALARLKMGRCVGVFPEGGIRDGEASVLAGAPLRPGIGALAQMSGAPVQPAVILGSDRLYSSKAWRPWKKTSVWMNFGEVIHCGGPSRADRESFEAKLTAAIRSLGTELRERFHLTEDDLPQPAWRRQGREKPPEQP